MKIEEVKQEIWRIEAKLKLNKSGLKRGRVEREIACDTDKLYGPLSQAIDYLKTIQKTHPQASLDEHWTGYEDMYMRFAWSEEETDQEYLKNLQSCLWDRKRKEEKHNQEIADKQKRIAKLEKELSALKGK